MTTEAVLNAVNEHATVTATALKGLGDQVAEQRAEMEVIQQQVAGAINNAPSMAKKTFMAQVDKSEQLAAMKNGLSKSANIPLQNVSVKALVNDSSLTNTQFDTPAHRYGQIAEDARRNITLLDVLPSLPLVSGSFEYMQLDGYSNAADYQEKQGDKKAVQNTVAALKTANIATIAVTEKASEQVLSDSPMLAQFLQSRMVHNALSKLEAEIINGVGGTGKISGLKGQATAFTPSATQLPDQIGQAIAQLEITGWNASVIILPPAVWHRVRSERDTNSAYVAGGWNNPAMANIWGVPVVPSASLTDTALILDSSQVLLLDRQQPAFAFNYSEDGFETNILTARAELRAGCAVLSPSAVLSIPA